MADPRTDPRSCVSVRKSSHVLGFLIVPGVIAAAAFFGAGRHPGLLLIRAAACVVMGLACLVNAARCHRLHCYITGPYFLLLAVAACNVADLSLIFTQLKLEPERIVPVERRARRV